MAVFGTYGDLARLLGDAPLFAEALDHLRQCFAKGTEANLHLAQLADGATHRTELRDGVFVLESAYLTRLRDHCFFEAHRRYIDVQAVLEGEEFIEVAPVERLRVDAPYVAERDLATFTDFAFASRLRLGPGDLAVFFPSDGHRPCLQCTGPVLVRKAVVKVPVSAGQVLPG